MHDIHIWFASFADLPCADLAARHAETLDSEERARRDRFVFERDRLAFAVSHVLLRQVLSRYGSLAAANWRYQFNSWGKPKLAEPHDAPGLSFNLSHTRGAALIGIARDVELGVDVEMTQRDAACLELADRYFSPSEVAALRALPPELQRDRFFELWTLKEAYIKARGMGLAIPLDQFSFRFPGAYSREGDVTPAISFTPPLVDRPDQWRFVERPIGPTFRAAAAVQVAPAAEVSFRWLRMRSDNPAEAEPLEP